MALKTNLLAWWDGENRHDSHTGYHDLTENGDVTYPAGKVGNCFQPAQSGNKYWSIPNADASAFDLGTKDFTIAFWLEQVDHGGNDTIFEYGDANATEAGITVWSSGDDNMIAYLSDGTTRIGKFYNAGLTSGVFNCVVIEVDRSGSMTLYINNVSVGTVDISGISAADIQPTTDLFIGNGSAGRADNKIDSVAVWDRLLGSTDRDAYYNSGAGTTIDTEIQTEYNYSGSGAKVWEIKAKATEVPGTAAIECPVLTILAADLPDELHDSDETATVEASGAGSLRLSRSADGSNQLPLKVTKFIPASGGGDVILRTNNRDDLDGAADTSLWLWWFPSGHSKVQPPRTSLYGASSVSDNPHWDLEEDPSGTAPQMRDMSANGNDGTTSGMVSGDSVAGRIGQGLDFNGADHVDFDNDASLNFDTAFTLYSWFSMDATTGTQTLVSRRDQALTPAGEWGININQDGGSDFVQCFFHDGTSFQVHSIGWAANFTAGTMAKIDFTAEESGSDVVTKIYVNGSLVDTKTHTSKTLSTTSTARVRIGGARYPSTDDEDFNGVIDEVGIKGRALSADEIGAIYNIEKASSTFWDSTALVADAGAAADDHVLVTSDGSISAQLDATTITQVHVLAPTGMSVASSLEAVAISQIHILSPDDSSVTLQLDAAVISQVHVLNPDNGLITTQLDTSGVVQNGDDYTLSPGDLSVVTSLDTTSISQIHILNPLDGSVSVVMDTMAITQIHVIAPDDGTITTQLDTTLVVLPSTVSSASISLGGGYSATITLGSF